jgi:hypothetical protein
MAVNQNGEEKAAGVVFISVAFDIPRTIMTLEVA